MVLNLNEPLLDTLKGLPIRDVEADKHRVRVLIEQPSDGAEALLTSGVPDLKLHVGLSAHDHSKVAEFDPDGHVVLLFEDLVNEAGQDTTLAHTCIADDNHFEQGVLLEILCSRARLESV